MGCDRFLGCGGAIAFGVWECDRWLGVWGKCDRYLGMRGCDRCLGFVECDRCFGVWGGAIAFGDVGMRSLFGVWGGAIAKRSVGIAVWDVGVR